MERELKFRGKRIDNGEWVFGCLLIDRQGDYFIYIPEEGIAYKHLVDPKTVGQFTGLLDRNSKEIYEGDKLRALHFIEGKKKHYLYHRIEWCERLTGWQCISMNSKEGKEVNGNPQLFVYIKNNEYEVIGTIHDEPVKQE